MSTTIYTIGGGSILEYAFNGMAVIAGHNDYKQVFAITGILGLFWIMLSNMLSASWQNSVKWFVVAAISYNVLLVPRTTANIIDHLEPAIPRTVDNVPYGIAQMASFTSKIGESLTRMFELGLSLPDDISYTKGGFLMGSELLKNVGRIRITDSLLNQNMKAFAERCIIRSLALGWWPDGQMQKAPNLEKFLSNNALSGLRKVALQKEDTSWQIISCHEAWNGNGSYAGLRSELEPEGYKWAAKLARNMNYHVGNDQHSVNTAALEQMLPATYQYFFNQSETASSILKHHLVSAALYEARGDQLESYGRSRAEIQAFRTYAINGAMAKQFMPMVRIILEMIIYMSYLVVAILIILPGASTVFYTYLIGMAWISCWGPIYAILHFITTFFQRAMITGIIDQGTGYSAFNVDNVHNALYDVGAVASYMSLFVPFLAWFLLKGFQGMVHMAGSILAPAMSASTAAAEEMTTGNISLGNVNMDNQTFSNTSGNKHDDSFYESNSSVGIQNREGTVFTAHPSGDLRVNQEMATSNLRNSLSGSIGMQKLYSTAASESMRVSNDLQNSAMQSSTNGWDAVFQSEQFNSSTDTNGIGYSENISASESKELQRFSDAAERFAEEHNLSKSASASALMSASGGFEIMGVGAKSSFELSGNTAESDILSNAKEFIEKESLGEAIKTAKDFTESKNFNLTDSEGNSLSDSIKSSFAASEAYSKSASEHLTKSQEYSQQASNSENIGSHVNINFNDDYVSWLQKEYAGENITSLLNNEQLQKDFMEDKYDELIAKYGVTDSSLPNAYADVEKDFGKIDVNEKTDDLFVKYSESKGSIAEHNQLNKIREDVDTSGLENKVTETHSNISNWIENSEVLDNNHINQIREKTDGELEVTTIADNEGLSREELKDERGDND